MNQKFTSRKFVKIPFEPENTKGNGGPSQILYFLGKNGMLFGGPSQ
jgi:hypothetical protein